MRCSVCVWPCSSDGSGGGGGGGWAGVLITRVNINAWASGARTRSRGRIFGWSHFIIKLVFCVCVGGFGCECVCVFISTPRIVFERSAAANRACTHPKTWYMPNAQQVKMLIIGLHMCSLVQPTTKPTKQHPPRPPHPRVFYPRHTIWAK